MIIQHCRLNLNPSNVKPIVAVSQYDTARQIVFHLYEDDTEYTPQAGASAKVLIGTEQLEGTISGSTVTFEINENLTQNEISKFGETNILCGIYNTSRIFNTTTDKIVFGNSANTLIYIRDNSFNGDYSAFKTAMSGVYLYYEKSNPEPLHIASLVSEQGEIHLYNDNGVLIGECTEQISSQSGFLPTKIMLNDNGVAYSQKINLHVEQ